MDDRCGAAAVEGIYILKPREKNLQFSEGILLLVHSRSYPWVLGQGGCFSGGGGGATVNGWSRGDSLGSGGAKGISG